MRAAYREQMDNFSHDLIIMSDNVHSLMTLASQALVESALQPAEEALSMRDELDELRARCEDRAVSLLALENPMAKDLRQVISSIYIVEDYYRMGRLAQHIAESARRRHPEPVVPNEILGYQSSCRCGPPGFHPRSSSRLCRCTPDRRCIAAASAGFPADRRWSCAWSWGCALLGRVR